MGDNIGWQIGPDEIANILRPGEDLLEETVVGARGLEELMVQAYPVLEDEASKDSFISYFRVPKIPLGTS